MARIFVTGSADGLGRAAAETLLGDGHEVVVHARSPGRLARSTALSRGAAAVVGDLADPEPDPGGRRPGQPARPLDAVIHNAGVFRGPQVLPVNVVAPYLLTALIQRPRRLVYLSSGMHPADEPARRPRLERTTADRLLLRQQAVRHHPRHWPWPDFGPTSTATPSTPAGCRPGWAAPARPTTCGSGT